jgi:hypothetical protein
MVTFRITKLSPSPHLNTKGGTGEVGDVMQALQVDGAFAVDRVHVYHHGGFELGPVAYRQKHFRCHRILYTGLVFSGW